MYALGALLIAAKALCAQGTFSVKCLVRALFALARRDVNSVSAASTALVTTPPPRNLAHVLAGHPRALTLTIVRSLLVLSKEAFMDYVRAVVTTEKNILIEGGFDSRGYPLDAMLHDYVWALDGDTDDKQTLLDGAGSYLQAV